ncbi:transposase [Anaerococcus porci]|uniref:transposase n=1 Tax=Anaerococcus porci TaxID=2652269 RepID=UPI00389912E9
MNDDLETTIVKIYKNSITTREIASLISRMYGHYYLASTKLNISKLVDKDIKTFHQIMKTH